MRIKTNIAWLVILMFISIWGINNRAMAVITDTVSATGAIVEDLISGPLLDNFNDGGHTNLWGGTTAGFEVGGGTCDIDSSYNADLNNVYGRNDFSLELSYDVSSLNSYAGYYSNLDGANLSGYRYLSFWVKGASGGRYFKIELKNNSADVNRNHAAVYITDYLDNGVTTSWQKVVIPLDAFANINDWTNMKEFVIVFENYQHDLYNNQTTGTIYIDDIYFGNLFLGYVRLDHYGDKLGICAMGGNMGDMDNVPPVKVYSFSNTDYIGSPCSSYSLLSEYDVDSGWAGVFIIIGGGDNGWTKMSKDFSDYERLNLWIKAKSAGENPKAIVVEIKETEGHKWPVSETYATEISTSWQEYELDITQNILGDPVSRANIKEIAIVYAKENWAYGIDWGISQYEGSLVGGIYMDNIEFRDINYTGPDTTPPPTEPTIPNIITGGGGIVTVSTTADAFINDFDDNIECVRFEYNDGGTWKTIGTDYDTTDTAYSVTWDVSIINPGSYQVRAVAMDPAGNTTLSGETTYIKP